MLRFLRNIGKLNDRDADDASAPDSSLIDTLRAAAILGKAALGQRAGRDDPRVGQRVLGQGTQVPADFTRGKLCAKSRRLLPARGRSHRRVPA